MHNGVAWRCMALHGVAHVDGIDACLVLCSMDTHGTHCDQVMKTGAFSGAKSLAEFQCRKFGRVSKWGIPFLKNEGEIRHYDDCGGFWAYPIFGHSHCVLFGSCLLIPFVFLLQELAVSVENRSHFF